MCDLLPQDSQGNVVVGYKFNLEVVLPTTYFQAREDMPKDYTASLTISRYKFIVGLSEKVNFQLNRQGTQTWNDINPIIEERPYVPGNFSVDKQALFHFPIHQRNNHFNVKVYSESAFPISLISMTWEGNYSPRFYKRV